MCLGFPGRIVEVDEDGVTVETEGRLRRASSILFGDLAAGDWVVVAAGTVVDRLDRAAAEEIRTTLHRAIASDAAAAASGGTR